MKVVCLAATKGGVGKTSLTTALAVEAAASGEQIGLIDIDPQGSTAWWFHRRENKERLEIYVEPDDGKSVSDGLAEARRAGATLCLIDTPPALLQVIEEGCRNSDLVVIAVRPSPLDMLAIDPVVELCSTELHKPFVFVLNQMPARSSFSESARDYLTQNGSGGKVLKTEIGLRQGFAMAMVRGETAPEIERDGKAGEEIKALWRELKRALAKV